MNPRDNDLEWLASNFPELAYAPADQRIEENFASALPLTGTPAN